MGFLYIRLVHVWSHILVCGSDITGRTYALSLYSWYNQHDFLFGQRTYLGYSLWLLRFDLRDRINDCLIGFTLCTVQLNCILCWYGLGICTEEGSPGRWRLNILRYSTTQSCSILDKNDLANGIILWGTSWAIHGELRKSRSSWKHSYLGNVARDPQNCSWRNEPWFNLGYPGNRIHH